MGIFRSKLIDCTIHPAGWVKLPSGVWISKLPVWDECEQIAARPGRGKMREWLASCGRRMPSAAEYGELRRLALHIDPYTLPTTAMLRADGVPKPWVDEKGRDTPHMARYRQANMSTLAWAKLHDAEVFRRLKAAGWTDEAIANFGKHWCLEGIIGWYLRNGGRWQPLYTLHGDGHCDYGTTTHAVSLSAPETGRPGPGGNDKGDPSSGDDAQAGAGSDPVSGVFRTPPRPTRLGDPDTEAVKAWQIYLGVKVDGVHGHVTEDATVTWLTTWGFARPLRKGADRPDNDPGPPQSDANVTPPDTIPGPPPSGVTALRPLSSVERAQLFGRFAYRHAPTRDDQEHILILDDWADRHIVRAVIPQLARIPGVMWQGKRSGRGPSSGATCCHRLIADQLAALWQAWEDAGLLELVITWGGLWNPRLRRKSKTTLSAHAWGTAFDINAYPWNRMGYTPAELGERGSVRELVPLAHEYGFHWGGDFLGRPDGMHFSAAEVLDA